MKKLLLVLLVAVACGSPDEQEGPQLLTIPADHCGVLTSSDGQAMRLGTEPDDLAEVPPRVQYAVSFDFHFYAEHAKLEPCPGTEPW